MPTFYKGAGLGTHWHKNDACLMGFTAHSPGAAPTTEELITHVAIGTEESPYISLTRSYAVAWTYAVFFGRENPSSDRPAYVYEINIEEDLFQELQCRDPVEEVVQTLQHPIHADSHEPVPFYQHNGLPDFLLGVANPGLMSDFVVGLHPQPPGSGALCEPNLTLQFKTLVHSLRDAEILIRSHVPRDCVEQRFEVFAESGSNYPRRNNDEPI